MHDPVNSGSPTSHEGAAGTVPDDVLATSDLVFRGVLKPRGMQSHAGVTLGRPLSYALGDTTSGVFAGADRRTLLLCFPFDLEEMPTGYGYRKIELAVTFDDEAVMALDMQPGPGRADPDGERVATFGLGRSGLRWVFHAPRAGGTLRPDGRWAQAVVALPRPFTAVSGRLRLRGVIEHPLLTGTRTEGEVQTREDVPFLVSRADLWTGAPLAPQVPRPGSWALADFEDAGAPDDRLPPGHQRLCFAVDIERYSARSNADMIRLQRALLRVMRAVCARAEVPWDACGRQAQGDGYLLVLPPDIDDTRVVPRLMHGLTDALAVVNRESPGSARAGTPARVRMRAAFHHGIVHEADSGYAGSAIVELFRMLDSDPVRALLMDDQATDLVVAVSDRTYQDLLVHGYEGLSPVGFMRTEVAVKQFVGVAWIRSQKASGPAVQEGLSVARAGIARRT
ncbi:hypothetical protein AB0D66_18390 [Streptomyces sp. NPDC048270]|uniref:hypothetical protein n=1 Tax=Streptomyces sp. NPDC048270 TaxID=3154615 RepID=UPI0033CE732F